MSNTVNLNASISASINGQSWPQITANSQRAMVGDSAAIFSQDIPNTWTALAIPAAIATIGELLFVPGAPAATGTLIQVALDNAGLHMVSDGVAIGRPFPIPLPSSVFYVKSDAAGADTVPIQVFAAQR